MRDRARPRAVLVPRVEEALPKFLQRLGVVMYGASWTRKSLQPRTNAASNEPSPGSDDECYAMVCDQIVSSLRSGLLTARVKLTVTVREELRRSSTVVPDNSDEGWSSAEDDLINEPEWFESDDGTPKLCVFVVKSSFWNRNDVQSRLDWKNSTAKISLDALEHAEAHRTAPAFIYNDLSEVDVPIHIGHPDTVISKMFQYEKLPDEEWFSRYRQYRKNSRLEAIAAGWREIAISRLEAKTTRYTWLAEIMVQYLNVQGLEVEDDDVIRSEVKQAFREMARNMLHQLENEERNDPVLISSNVHKRKAGDRP